MHLKLAAILFVGIASTVVAAACSDSGSSDSSVPATSTPGAAAQAEATPTVRAASTAPATAAATTQAATPAASATRAVQTKINANTATRAQLQAAFEAAGISNPSQWAREVEEYRPYPTTDPNFAKLRGELAKYNPGPGVVDAIVALLVP